MLDDLKNEVCEIAKKAQRDGLCKHKSGNFLPGIRRADISSLHRPV